MLDSWKRGRWHQPHATSGSVTFERLAVEQMSAKSVRNSEKREKTMNDINTL